VWSKAEVLAKRAEVARMTEAKREAFGEKWSNENKGQVFGYFPLFPFHAVVTDLLHLYLNQVNNAVEEAVHSHLYAPKTQYKEQPKLQKLAEAISVEINARVNSAKCDGGAGLMMKLGGDHEHMKHTNGPKVKQLSRDPTLLPDMVRIMKPLYDLKEAKDHPSVQRRPLSQEELQVAVAAAACTAAAAAKAATAQSQPAVQKSKGGWLAKGKRQRSEKASRAVILPSASAAADGPGPVGGHGAVD